MTVLGKGRPPAAKTWGQRLKFRLLLGLILLLAGGLGSAALLFAQAGSIYDYVDSADHKKLPPVDVIVCLSGAKGRIAGASELWDEYRQKDPSTTPGLYFSGLGPKANWNVLSQQIRPDIFDRLTPQVVTLETHSVNTIDNAKWFLRFFEKHRWKRILLVTSSYHMRRAQLAFDFIFRDIPDQPHIETISLDTQTFNSEGWWKSPIGIDVTVREYMKWMFYRLRFGKHDSI